MGKKGIRCLATACVLSAVALGVHVAEARAIDDAAFILDVRGDLNGNGKVDATEVGNALDFSSSAPITATVPAHTGSDPCPTNYTFAPPMYAMTTNTYPAIYIPQDNYYDERGTNFVANVCIDLKNAAVTEGTTQTAYVRFRWDGNSITNFACNSWLFLNGFNWNYSGWGVFIQQGAGSNPTTGQLGVMVPQCVATVGGGGTIKRGAWYDLFATVSPRSESNSKAVIHLLPVPSMYHQGDEDRDVFNTPTFQRMENLTSAYPLLAFTAAGQNTLRLGAEENNRNYWTEIKASNNNASKTFRGAIARMMFWTRELTQDEMWDIVSGHDGAMWSLGAVNGSADEFAATDAAETQVATNAWRTMKKSLTSADPTLTVVGELPASEVGLDHLVTLVPVQKPEGYCPVRLAVNGVTVGNFDLARRSGRNAYVPGKFWTRDADGTATLTITRLAPFDAPLNIDALTVAGSWMLGKADGANSEFEREGLVSAHVVRGDTNAKHVMRANLGEPFTSSRAIYFHLYVPPETADIYDSSFETRVTMMADQAKLSGHATMSFWLNGEEQEIRHDVSTGDVLNFPIPAGKLQPGMNSLVVSNAITKADCTAVGASSAWVCLDYYRFLTVPERSGTFLLLR